MTEHLTLYTARVCPYAHRVEIALAESGIPFTRYEIDLTNKPKWYELRINPASKVPAAAYGGPQTDPADPSPQSTKITESLVLLEFIADLAVASATFKPILPKTPVLRAKARFFIDAVSNFFVPGFVTVSRGQVDQSKVLAGIDKIQNLLPEEDKFAVGQEFTIADAAIAPFIVRLEVVLDVISNVDQETKNFAKILAEDPKYARYRKYVKDIKDRESVKKTWADSEPIIRQRAEEKVASLRAEKAA